MVLPGAFYIFKHAGKDRPFVIQPGHEGEFL